MISRLFSFFLLVMFSPLFFIVALIIIFDDGLPIIFTQKRVGLNNTYFRIFKFRTMKKNTPDIPTHLVNNSKSHFTRIGPILRKISIDEIPQLINVLRGEMTFIGPRPALYNQYDLIKLRTKVGVNKLAPGITGWAQVNGRDELSIPEKVKMDQFYLNNQSIWLDIKILFLTNLKVIKSEGISS